tara:strand:- start:1350 stop:2735 length:1386 start_codon:yes stop_codon:yes gene_type:complete
MSVPDNYEIIQTTSTDAQIRVDIDWQYDSITDLYIWQQDTDTGVITYFNLGDFAVVEKSDGSGDYIEVENVSTATALVNTARRSPLTQTYDLLNSEALDPVALVEALDKAIKILQEQDSITLTPDRRVITSVNPFDIPDKVTRAGKLLSFDENGDVQFTTSDEALDQAIGYAEEWANNPEDQLVSAGAGGDQIDDYSALHHSKKSEGFSQASETSATNSQNSALASASSASDASTSESNASTSETNALASENKAQKWAEEDEDVEVETGEYSAKHYALKAQASSESDGVLLGGVDLTGQQNADIFWDSSWDQYDFIKIIIEGAVSSQGSGFGVAYSPDNTSTWLDLDGTGTPSSNNALSPWGGTVGTDTVNLEYEIGINNSTKTPFLRKVDGSLSGRIPTIQGYSAEYTAPSSLGSYTDSGNFMWWDTGVNGFDATGVFRLLRTLNTWSSGFFKITGHKYP